jgi:acyl-CoA synthetase (AMP-forming)/AMP-acid ligase II
MKELVYSRVLLPALENHAGKEAFIDGDYRGTFEQHGDRVSRLCAALSSELGITRSDRFAIMATNSHQYLELYHAAFLGGGVINPLNLRLAGKELDYIVRNSGTEVVFVDALFAPLFAQAMAEAGDDSPIRHTVLIGDSADAPYDMTYEDLIGSVDGRFPDEPEEDDPVILMYTGGTTGLPKGVLLDQRAEMLNLYHVAGTLDFDPDSVFLHQTPMFHAASMGGILGIPALGASSVFIPLFDPAGVLELTAAHQVTQTVMVPTMIGLMLADPAFEPEKLASLRQLTYGASPMSPALLDKLLGLYPDLEVSQGYGMTECSAVLTWLDGADHRKGGARLRSAGRPLLGVTLCIQDDEGNTVARGETGEVCARAGNFMTEYWNNPEATDEVFQGGWYHTGDAGYLDDEGYLFLVDRVKDMIVSGGENVYSAEVESVLSKHEAVAQVAVIGIPHETWGEQVHAIIVLDEGGEVTVEELQVFAKQSIAGYKVPKSIDFRDEPLPLSGAMKVLKRELRAPFWADQDRSV